MKNVVCILEKGPLGLKQCKTEKKIKSVALAIIKLCLSEGICQSANQPVENSLKYIFLKFCNNILD